MLVSIGSCSSSRASSLVSSDTSFSSSSFLSLAATFLAVGVDLAAGVGVEADFFAGLSFFVYNKGNLNQKKLENRFTF